MVTFAGYEVLGHVAQGSTGVVWQARQVELDRIVAIKELSPTLLSAPGFLQRFRAEAQLLAVLDDPHVVRIFDYVEEPARAYLVQEWVDGAPLQAVLQQHGSLTPEQSLGVLRGGLIGLAHAHSRGLVHRDISPANILLDRGGTSKLVDFGLAAQTDQGLAPGAATSVGTPAFSSPEAVTGAPMTTRSDVYSVAAVLYLLLSGRLPYAGNVHDVLRAHTSAPVPKLDSHGPELGGLLARGMAKNPAERPPDAAAFLAELEQAAIQRYGAGWLNRASVAGLVTATTAATGATAVSAGSTAAATAPAQTVAYGATATPTGGTAQLAATTTRTGARILGMPLAAVITIALVVIAAIAATVVVVTNNSSSSTAAQEGAGATEAETQASSEPVATTTTTPQVPAFSGAYALALTYTGSSGPTADDHPVGQVQDAVWQVTPSCSDGFCDVSVVSSSGRTFDYIYADGTWTRTSPAVDVECFDELSGQPIGLTTVGSVVSTLQPAGEFDPDGGTPLQALTGSGSDTFAADCDGNPATYEYSLSLTRTGD